MRYKISIVFLLLFKLVAGQNVDSLEAILKTKIHDTSRVLLLCRISGELTHTDLKKSLKYAYKSLYLTQKIGYEKGLAETYARIGNIHSLNSNDSALWYLFNAKTIKQKLKDYKGVASVCSIIGNAYDIMGNTEQALNYYVKSLKLYDSLAIDKGIAGACLGIGNVFVELKNDRKAIEYFERSVEAYTKINSPYKTWAMNNLASCYKNIGDINKAKYLYEESLRLKLENKDYYGTIAGYDNIGHLLQDEKKYEEALGYFMHALQIVKKYDFEKETLANSYGNIAGALLLMKRTSLSKRYLDSLRITLEHVNLYEKKLIFLKLSSSYYEAIEDYRNAYAYKSKYYTLKDSMINIEMSRQIAEADARYANEKKQKDIELLQKDTAIQKIAMDKQQVQKNGFIAGFVIVFILLLFIFKSYRQKQKDNILITLQKKEVELQKFLVDEKQKEILDSINYAKRIQYALLAHRDFLKNNIPENFVYFNPKDIVSGDFYWAAKKGDKFYLAVCDCTGHGVPGAFMSLLNIGFLREAINEKEIEEPNEVFNFVRQRLIDNISNEGQKDGFDGILICMDQKSKKITYAAANNKPILVQEGKIVELPADRMPVGIGERKDDFKLFQIDSHDGDTLYLYTDGYADQFGGARGKKFKNKTLNELILTHRSKLLDEQSKILRATFDEWRGKLEQVDDVCIIGIRL